MTDLPKTFDPAAIEAHWYAHWEGEGRFRPERPDAVPFTIVMPPPNVTGSLHIGHALDNTLQDILTRHARLKGKDALWVVGTDHAGIATQMVVERQLDGEGLKRADLGRDAFVERVWDWKAESGGAITRQLRRLGASCDWANERFTMDEGFSKAVTHVFVELHRRGLLYRDKRLVNWDPHFRTAISDLEVEQREVNGHFWHFRYPLEDGSGHISIATTRPETILGDGAVAVHPDDDRYRHLVGKRCLLPIVGRLIPIIADEHVKIDFGSGAVKITAAHDWNDYEVARRHPEANIPLINLMNADATMSDACPPDYRGLDRYAARAKVVADFDALGLLEKIEDRVHMVPYGDRSGVVIEPWLTEQWYVDAATLAGPAIDAVRSGAIKLVPETWKKTWYHWLENIQPWCVSRQLWWGHQVPAWYGPHPTGHRSEDVDFGQKLTFVVETESSAIQSFADSFRCDVSEIYVSEKALSVFDWAEHPERAAGKKVPIWRDPDVLDTWFSSALWPFATLGWPEKPLPPEGGAEPPKVPTMQSVGGKAAEGGGGDAADIDPSLTASPTPRPPPLAGRGGSDLARHYPNDILISGFDILFFWDARMVMQGIQFMEEVPFKTLYLHGLVRDAQGAKMSKSKGNTVDPLGLIDRFGADALRFTMAAMESQGRDIKLDERRVEGYRNFATKLWNAARFAQGQGIGASITLEPPPAALPVNRWIVAETVRTVQALDLALADLRFDEAANGIYHFVWDRFCDWYLELIKTQIDAETKAVAGWVLDQILVMLHPFMPFITEELWHAMGPRGNDLIVARWPMADARAIDPEAAAEIEWLITLITNVRTLRNEVGIPFGAWLLPDLIDATPLARNRLISYGATLKRIIRFANFENLKEVESIRAGTAQIVVDGTSFLFELADYIDLDAERARLAKAAEAAEKERDALAKRLGNPGFVEKAKPEAVEKARADHADRTGEAERLRAALARLG